MGCMHSQPSRAKNSQSAIRKSIISKPTLIMSPTSSFSFESEKRVVPQSPCSSFTKSKISTESNSLVRDATIPTFILSPASPYSQKDGGQANYISETEIKAITSQVTKFVGLLMGYGQLIEKMHVALKKDLDVIVGLLPLHVSPTSALQIDEGIGKEHETPGSGDHGKQETEIMKINLKSSRSTRLVRKPSHPHLPSPNKFVPGPAYIPASPSSIAHKHLLSIQSSLTTTYISQSSNFRSKYWPLITLLPRNWIHFSRLADAEKEVDVWRHETRLKGEFGKRDGVLISCIRALGLLTSTSSSSEEGEAAFENFEDMVVGRMFEILVGVLKNIERERERRGWSDKGVDGKEWSPCMKWRVFGLVLKERVKVLREKREEILRERVGLSGVLLGVYEDVREGLHRGGG